MCPPPPTRETTVFHDTNRRCFMMVNQMAPPRACGICHNPIDEYSICRGDNGGLEYHRNCYTMKFKSLEDSWERIGASIRIRNPYTGETSRAIIVRRPYIHRRKVFMGALDEFGVLGNVHISDVYKSELDVDVSLVKELIGNCRRRYNRAKRLRDQARWSSRKNALERGIPVGVTQEDRRRTEQMLVHWTRNLAQMEEVCKAIGIPA
jgi:hypothetical protein